MKLNQMIPTVILSLTPLFAQAAPDCCTPPKAEKPYTLTRQDGKQASFKGLVDHTGAPVDDAYIQKHFAGKRLAIYFGFPDCDWFCPSSIQAIKSADSAFAEKYPAQAHNVQYLFIASRTKPLDGSDYKPEDMAKWIKPIEGAIGLTGSAEVLQPLLRGMSVNNAAGVHLPIVIFTDETGKVTGSANAVLPSPDGKKVPPPNTAAVFAGMEKFLIRPETKPAAPSPAP